ncbi:MAG: potassium channel family protein [Steroidobacteraceae bacterium]|nr:potassium channel family protein [Steroidobacteraceae bacterium]
MKLTAQAIAAKRPFKQWRFFQLTLAMMFWMLVYPRLTNPWFAHLILQALLVDLLMVTIWATPQWRHIHRLLIGFLLLAVGASVAALLPMPPAWIRIDNTVQGMMHLPILSACVVGILTFVFRAERPTPDGIFATVVAYLLIAMIFGQLYGIALVWNPDALQLTEQLQQMNPQQRGGEILYFSVITMSTVGYGDVLPTSEFTRMLAAIQAVFGQFYVAVVVAVFVGMYAAQAREESLSRRTHAGRDDDSPGPRA